MSQGFSLAYQLAWLPRLLLAGVGAPKAFPAAPLMRKSAVTGHSRRILFLGDLTAVANRSCPRFSDEFQAFCRAADIVVANCESPIVSRSRSPLLTRAGLCHAMSAQFLSDVLGAAGIAPGRLILSLANNHICDQGEAGLEETAAQLTAMGIAFVGLEGGREGGWESVLLGNTKIAFLAYTRWRNGWPGLYKESVRGPPPGFAIPKEADLTCALPHWGTEFAFRPDLAVSEEATRLADTGTDLIVGTHPHVVQPLAQEGAALVAYSLGDFVGSVLAHTPWPLRLSMALAVEVVPGMPHGARIAGYEARMFFRHAVDGCEEIDWVETLPAHRRKRCETLIARIMRNAEDTSALDITTEAPAVAR